MRTEKRKTVLLQGLEVGAVGDRGEARTNEELRGRWVVPPLLLVISFLMRHERSEVSEVEGLGLLASRVESWVVLGDVAIEEVGLGVATSLDEIFHSVEWIPYF